MARNIHMKLYFYLWVCDMEFLLALPIPPARPLPGPREPIHAHLCEPISSPMFATCLQVRKKIGHTLHWNIDLGLPSRHTFTHKPAESPAEHQPGRQPRPATWSSLPLPPTYGPHLCHRPWTWPRPSRNLPVREYRPFIDYQPLISDTLLCQYSIIVIVSR